MLGIHLTELILILIIIAMTIGVPVVVVLVMSKAKASQRQLPAKDVDRLPDENLSEAEVDPDQSAGPS